MKVIKNIMELGRIRPTVVTLGNFDGIHLGHQKLLSKIRQRSSILKAPSIVYTFDPHPRKVLTPESFLPLILDLTEKERLIENFGISYLVHAPFNKKFASMSAKDFVTKILHKGLNAKEIWVGENYNFGAKRSGDITLLKAMGKDLGFTVKTVAGKTLGGKLISSTRLRDELKSGDMGAVRQLTGRYQCVTGQVVKGKNLGRSIGFPTANISAKNPTLPKEGVYATFTKIKRTLYPSVVNIGTTPTMGVKNLTMEVHIMDFNKMIYGENTRTYFVKRLRDEIKFPSKEALIKAINNDITKAKKILTNKIKTQLF